MVFIIKRGTGCKPLNDCSFMCFLFLSFLIPFFFNIKDAQGFNNKRHNIMKNELKQDIKGQHFNTRLHTEATRKGSGKNTLCKADLNNPTAY